MVDQGAVKSGLKKEFISIEKFIWIYYAKKDGFIALFALSRNC